MDKKILTFLRKSQSYVSGEEISRSLNMSRSAIWKHIQELRDNGYDIVAVPHLGYQLVTTPDKLLPQEIQHNLKTKIFGKKIAYYETTSSTMDAAFSLGLDGAQEGTVVCAETQTKGRGRLGRSWISPKAKGVYVSIILRPEVAPSEISCVTLLSAVAVCEAIKNTADIQPLIKWPNDIMIDGKKVAGILTELNAEADRVKFLVVGVGINVDAPRDVLPKEGTSLFSETKRHISRVALTQEVLRRLEHWYSVLKKEEFVPIADRWRELSFTLQKHIRVADPHGFIEGEAVDIDADGGLLIRTNSGTVTKKMAGDVTVLR